MLAVVFLAVLVISPATALHVDHKQGAEETQASEQMMNMSYMRHLRLREGRTPLGDFQLPGLPPLSKLQLPGLPSLGELIPPPPRMPSLSDLIEGIPGMAGMDMNNKFCMICGHPLKSRTTKGTKYKKPRTDCGGSMEQPDARDVPLYTFAKSGSERESGLPTNAFCELNLQKSCTDAVNNRDYMYYAKSITGLELSPSLTYDWWYCKRNGWLKTELVDIAHSGDFDAMRNKGAELCDTQYAKYNWKTNISLNEMEKVYNGGMKRGVPTDDEANYLGAWNCAMGDAACDMTYCAYSFCDLGDEKPRLYKDCPGWNPVKGNRP